MSKCEDNENNIVEASTVERVKKSEEEEEEDSDDDCFADVGFMFEGAEPSKLETFEWKKAGIRVDLTAVDDDPGAVQSGHYLWPAARTLANHLVQHWSPQSSYASYSRILELGAGCGLGGLVALQLLERQKQHQQQQQQQQQEFSKQDHNNESGLVVFTDHDPGTLTRAKDNYIATNKVLQAKDDPDSATRVMFEALSWGDEKEASDLLSRSVKVDGCDSFDLLLGSDLIYCREVVRPLFHTAHLLLSHQHHEGDSQCAFLLTQSFAYDEETELEIDQCCSDFLFERIILEQDDPTRVQKFVRRTA